MKLIRKLLKWLDKPTNAFGPPTLYHDYMARWRTPIDKS